LHLIRLRTSFCITADISAMVVGQTSGHCVYPKNITTNLPRKSASVRSFP
jgi:hypothetical protein